MSNMLKKRNDRLRREYMELMSSPIANCAAQPLENDISVWHANIRVESIGVVFHFEIKYPVDYPRRAPKVKPFTTIKHPNVFGDYICLDILTMSTETANTPYRGWTSAYTISSLLVQLESFLFEAAETRGSYGIDTMTRSARNFRCSCGHHVGSMVPEITLSGAVAEEKAASLTVGEDEFFFLAECDNVVLDILLQFCDEETKTKISHISFGNLRVLDLALAKDRYRCFYTLQKIGEPRVVLGLGAQSFIMDRRSRKTGKKAPQLQQLHCSFDFMSHDAFKQGVRNNIWKDQEFDNFVPLYINSEHGKYALPLAEKCLTTMWTDARLKFNKRSTLTPATILETLTKMMNTTVVNMMKTVEDLEAGELQLFDSIKALEGFCSMHHLLLAFTKKYPGIKDVATRKVKRFIDNPQMRDKEVTPDIGELMIDVALSDYSWDDFSPAWLQETFVRNARWICAKYPNLLKIENASSCVRLTQSFNATRTGKRLAMFQRFFISEIASPARLRGNPDKNAILLKEYNLRMGLPERGMAERLQAHSRKVIACTNWWDYFGLIDFCPPGHARLSAWLRNCIKISDLKKYHEKHKILRYDEHHITFAHDTHQLEPLNCLCAGTLFKLPEGCKIVPGGAKAQVVQKKKSGIDICFVMDCTGSMSSWIATAKQRIEEIIQSVSRKSDGVVRFAMVGYRDHDSPGYGSDSWVLKHYDFTSSSSTAQRRVRTFNIGGGGGHEAMCCAMKRAADMSWNRDSHQIVVLIGDQPPHGFGGSGDYSYPNGCPCGEDTLRVVHTMEKTGIVVYPVDCGYESANRQTFYHALARITGGYAINLRESELLPKIVFGACMEEKLMDKLSGIIAPIYDNCLKSHSIGRFEQHCRSVYSELNAKNIKVESCLPADNYDETLEHQVDCLAYCMDIKQAKAMCENEYFIPIRRQTKLCSYMERPVTQCQVTKCMKRMKDVMAERRFLEKGCQYKSSAKFSKEAFKGRWMKFKQERGIRSFTPWNTLKPQQIRDFSDIPDGEKIRRATNKSGGSTATVGMSNLIPKDMVGKEIQVELNKQWVKVFVKRMLRGGKVSVEMPDGFEQAISEACNWRLIPKANPWGAKKATNAPAPAAKPAPAPPVVATPAPVQRQVQAPAPQPVVQNAPAPTVRRQQVQAPQPVAPAPAVRRQDPIGTPYRFPAPTMAKNQSVEVPEAVANRAVNHPRVVQQQQQPKANVNRSAQSDSGRSDLGRSVSRSASNDRHGPSPAHSFIVGQLVDCKASKEGDVHVGIVKTLQPLIIQVQGFQDGRWRFVRAKELTEVILCTNEAVYAGPDDRQPSTVRISSGTKVRVLEFVGEFAHVISPVDGWVRMKRGTDAPKAIPQPVAPVKPATPQPVVQSMPSVLPTIQCLVTQSMSAKDVALSCERSCGSLPKKVQIKLINNRRVGVVGFENQGDAEVIIKRGLVHLGQQLLVRWSQTSFPRERAI
jgi:ubiquitin-protein ligase/Mg-chelatase subunit ChlD